MHCPNLARVTWNGNTGFVSLRGLALRNFTSMTHLHVDGGAFFVHDVNVTRIQTGSEGPYMWDLCRGLERLSMNNATWFCSVNHERVPVTQNMLIKMVRLHPTLRWLRSDLTKENIAMLEQERPEIAFVA